MKSLEKLEHLNELGIQFMMESAKDGKIFLGFAQGTSSVPSGLTHWLTIGKNLEKMIDEMYSECEKVFSNKFHSNIIELKRKKPGKV